MTKRKTNKNTYVNKHTTPVSVSEQSIVNTGRKGFIYASKHGFEAKSISTRRATVDDATWDKIVKDLMEEYDEAWTKLADS